MCLGVLLIKCINLQMAFKHVHRNKKKTKWAWVPVTSVRNTVTGLDCCTIPVSVNKRHNTFTVRDHSTAVGYAECNLEDFWKWCCTLNQVKVTGEKLLPTKEEHFSTYTILQRSRQSYYKQIKMTLHNCSILATTWHMVGAACKHTQHPTFKG